MTGSIQNVFLYDAVTALDDSKADYAEVKKAADDTGLVDNSMFAMQKVDDLYSEKGSAEVYLIVPDDENNISNFF